MAGPTFFSEIMENFIELSKVGSSGDKKTYFVLLIITDGEIHDFKETVRLIVEASKYPCSIVIVGVGDGDFE